MVVVVLDPPGLKRVYEGCEHQGAHDVLYQLVFAEGTVATIVPNNKELQAHSSIRELLMSVIFTSLLRRFWQNRLPGTESLLNNYEGQTGTKRPQLDKSEACPHRFQDERGMRVQIHAEVCAYPSPGCSSKSPCQGQQIPR